MTFFVGQKVVCVDDRRRVSIKRGGWFSRLRSYIRLDHNLNRGHVYVVTHRVVMIADSGEQFEMLCLDKARCFEFPDLGFPGFQFKPLIQRKTDISVFTSLLNQKQREHEPTI